MVEVGQTVGHVMTFNKGNTKASRLNAIKVLEIRRRYAGGGCTMGQLSREYGVTSGTISNIINGLTWQHVGLVETDRSIATRAAHAMALPEEIDASQERLRRMLADEAEAQANGPVVLEKLMKEIAERKVRETKVNEQLAELTGDSNVSDDKADEAGPREAE